MFITDIPTKFLAEIVAGLVREGICFKAHMSDSADGGFFTIELTGGH
jgi:hypothetical protein